MAEVSRQIVSRVPCHTMRCRTLSDVSDVGSDSETNALTGIRVSHKGKANRHALRDFTVTDWFKDHIEIVGSPRPEQPQRQEDMMMATRSRQEAMQKVAFMAERYRAQMEQQKREILTRKVRSSPDLSVCEERRAPAVPSRCPRCTASCATARLLEDALRGLASRGAARLPRASPFDSREGALIIFDWDDTLLPTTFILQTVLPSLPQKEREEPLRATSPFYEELSAHAHLVGFILRVARRAARVAIVTNSMSPWVVASSTRFLPGLGIEGLLEELQIPVYYARRHVAELSKNATFTEMRLSFEIDHSTSARIGLDILPAEGDGPIRIARIDEFGLVGAWNAAHPSTPVLPGDWIVEVNGTREHLAEECRKAQVLRIEITREVPDRDPYIEAKRIDMEECVRHFYSRPDMRKNVLSIGDSPAEQTAVKEVLPRTGRPSTDPLCKTVNLLQHPTVQQLSNELRILLVWLSYMVKYKKDFDLAMNNLDALEKELFSPSRER